MRKNIKGLVLITGTTSGVGLNTLKPLLRIGWEVIAVNRSNKRAVEKAHQALTDSEMKNIHFIEIDLSDLDDVTENMFTEFIYDMPYTNSILKEHNVYRARLMKLKPRSNYTYHQDYTKRFHIPLITNDKCFFVIDEKVIRYPADGNYYIVDTTKLHTAINASTENRIHIIGCIDE